MLSLMFSSSRNKRRPNFYAIKPNSLSFSIMPTYHHFLDHLCKYRNDRIPLLSKYQTFYHLVLLNYQVLQGHLLILLLPNSTVLVLMLMLVLVLVILLVLGLVLVLVLDQQILPILILNIPPFHLLYLQKLLYQGILNHL